MSNLSIHRQTPTSGKNETKKDKQTRTRYEFVSIQTTVSPSRSGLSLTLTSPHASGSIAGGVTLRRQVRTVTTNVTKPHTLCQGSSPYHPTCPGLANVEAQGRETKHEPTQDSTRTQLCWSIGKNLRPEECPKAGSSSVRAKHLVSPN